MNIPAVPAIRSPPICADDDGAAAADADAGAEADAVTTGGEAAGAAADEAAGGAVLDASSLHATTRTAATETNRARLAMRVMKDLRS
jgi:hypothetical protein